MKNKNLLFIFGMILFLNLFSSVSANGVSISTCGNGVLEAGEQCDAGQLIYSSSSNYPQVYCSPATCTCGSGVTEEKHFAFNESVCAQITDCTPSDDGECSEEDRLFDELHPHCGCQSEPECRCRSNSIYNSWGDEGYFKCRSCATSIDQNLQQQLGAGWTWGSQWTQQTDSSGNSIPGPLVYAGSRCYCGDWWISGLLDHDTFPPCDYLNKRCQYLWNLESGMPEPNCIPYNTNVSTCANGQPVCSYPSLGNITNTCCASNQYCDSSGSGCVNITSTLQPQKMSVSVSIEVGAGNFEKRNIICKASTTPNKAGDYKFTFSVGSTTSSQIIKTVVDVPPCPEVFNPTPVSAEYEFPDILTKDSGALKCQVSYIFPTETNYTDSSKLNDLDKDGTVSKNQFPSLQSWSAYDVDDWVFNDTRYGDSTTEYSCLNSGSASYKDIVNETREKMKNCTIDNNNDAIGDFAACSYCRNPRAFEDADDIDNNGWGFCQANVSRPCRIEGDSYVGDGADDSSDINVLNSAGVGIGKMGCGPVKNNFNVTDNFCQMVDNVPGMGNYQRAVKWIDFVEDREIIERHPTIASDPDGSDTCLDGRHYLSDIGHLLSSYAFIPGGASDTGGPFPESVSNFYAQYGGLKSTGNVFVGYILYEAMVLVEPGNMKICRSYRTPIDVGEFNVPAVGLSLDESKAKQRGTIGTIFSDSFIDSFRGELNFNNFWSNYKDQIQQKDDAGNFKVKWATAFVSKDKCNDGVDNDGVEDLNSAAPYGNYLSVKGVNVDTSSFNSATGSYNLASSGDKVLGARLVDVDDPQCKFASSSSSAAVYPHYSWPSDYKINPLTTKPYCYDEDGDGFCGKKMVCTYNWYGQCQQWGADPSLNPLLYSNSRQFPDCDNNLGDDSIQYSHPNYMVPNAPQIPFYVSTRMGWDSPVVGTQLGAWNVHPFAPITSDNCFYGFDINCNKDMAEGYNTASLINGKTPFDDDPNTGKEFEYKHVQWTNPFGSQDSAPVDLQCFYYNPLTAIRDQYTIGITFSTTKVVVVAMTMAVIPGSGFVVFGLSVRDNFNLWNRAIFNNKNGAQDYVVAVADTALLGFSAKSLASTVLPANTLAIPSSSSYSLLPGVSKKTTDTVLANFAKFSKDSVNGKKSIFGLYGYF